MFDKNADETISWISDKEAEISTDELGQDLEELPKTFDRDFADSISDSEVEEVEKTVLDHLTSPEASQEK